MTIDVDDPRLDRLDELIARMERLGGVTLDAPALRAAPVNPDGTPGLVAAGELIESAWGNATANTLTRLHPLASFWKLSTIANTQVFGGGTLLTIGSFTAPKAGWYVVQINAYAFCGATAGAMNLHARAGGQAGLNNAVQLDINTGVTTPCADVFNLAAGAQTVQLGGTALAGSHNFMGGAFAVVTRVQTPPA